MSAASLVHADLARAAPSRAVSCQAFELRADDPLQLRDQTLLDPLVKEREIFLTLLQQSLEGELQ